MRVAITVSYTKTKIVEIDATPENFRASLLVEEADTMAADGNIPLSWERTIFEDADTEGDSYLDEVK